MTSHLKFGCEFCLRELTKETALLCDGRLESGRTCDRSMCRACAKNVQTIHFRLCRRVNGSRCHHETVDLCPACVQAGRNAGFLGGPGLRSKPPSGLDPRLPPELKVVEREPRQQSLFDAGPDAFEPRR